MMPKYQTKIERKSTKINLKLNFSSKIVFIVISILFYSSYSYSNPIILYSDLVNGPNKGGENNQGAFVTIWGTGFGNKRNSSFVTIGDELAANYHVWSDKRITFQIGNNARSGNIIVHVLDQKSNKLEFMINNGRIFFVDINADVNGDGSYEKPWNNPEFFVKQIMAGDICYFRKGSYTGKYGNITWGDRNFVLDSKHQGKDGLHVAFISYPGEAVRFSGRSGNFCLYGGSGSAHYVLISQFELFSRGSSYSSGGFWQNQESGASNVRLVGNKCYGDYNNQNTMTGIIYVTNSNHYILGNEIWNNAEKVEKNNHGVYVQCGADNVYIGYNMFHKVRMGHVIQVHTDGGERYIYENIHIFSNTIYGENKSDCRGINIGLVNKNSFGYIYNNLLYNLGQNFSGIIIYNGKWEIANNTLWNINGGMLMTNGFYGRNNMNCVWKNNILVSLDGSPYITNNGDSNFGLIDSNCYFGNGPGPGKGFYDKNAVNADPIFIENGKDFHLKNGSPCINKGTSELENGGEIDKEGTLRKKYLPIDIGAYEFK